MQKLQIVSPVEMSIALQQEITRSHESRYDHRLHGVLLVAQGLSCYEVANLLGQNPRTIERWVERFGSRGFAGLEEGERPGRPRRLGEREWTKIEKALRTEPSKLGLGQNLWDGKLLSHWIARDLGVHLGVRQCQRVFRHMGFRRRKPRPLIAQADPAAQAAFRKTPPPGSRSKR